MDYNKTTAELISGLEMFQEVNETNDETMIIILTECIEIYKQKINNKKMLNNNKT